MPSEDDYYSSDPSSDGPAPANSTDDDSDPSKSDQPEGNGALVPKSLFGDGGPEVGSECKFRVVHVYDDEVELEYVKDGDDKKSSKPAMDEAEGGLDTMAAMNDTAEA
jgi:hypothetical protein